MLNELQFGTSMASPSARRTTAFLGGTKVGVAHSGIGTDWSPKEISSVWVHPDYAGQGIGEALVQHVGYPMGEGVTERNDDPGDNRIPAARFTRPKHG